TMSRNPKQEVGDRARKEYSQDERELKSAYFVTSAIFGLKTAICWADGTRLHDVAIELDPHINKLARLESRMGEILSHEQRLQTLKETLDDIDEVEEKLESDGDRESGTKEPNLQMSSARRQHDEESLGVLDEAKERTPSELNSFIRRAQDAAVRMGLRGDSAQHV